MKQLFFKFMYMAPLYCCVVTGPIGVGKTTICERLTDAIRSEIKKYNNEDLLTKEIVYIPEYIDDENYEKLGHECLAKLTNGTLPIESFQQFVQSYYIDKFLTKNYNDKIVIMERTLSDSITVFTNNAYKNNKLNVLSLCSMMNNSIVLEGRAHVPNYFIRDFTFQKIDLTNDYKTKISQEQLPTHVKEIASCIVDDIINKKETKRVVGLYLNETFCYLNLLKRARKGEDYDRQYIRNIVRYYRNLYNLFETKETITFNDITSEEFYMF